MSTGNVKGFYEKVADDKALQAKLNAMHNNCGANRGEEVSELVKIAAAAGYDFTARDLARVIEAKPRKLPENELWKTVMAEECYEGKNYFCNAAYICGGGSYH